MHKVKLVQGEILIFKLRDSRRLWQIQGQKKIFHT